jgi:hypothetical protein
LNAIARSCVDDRFYTRCSNGPIALESRIVVNFFTRRVRVALVRVRRAACGKSRFLVENERDRVVIASWIRQANS